MAGSIQLQGTVTGLQSGGKTFGPVTISGSSTIGQVTDTVLASGDNTITVPSGAAAVVIAPPAANVIVLKIKGAGGDTGITISPTQPFMWVFPASPPASFILNAASAFTSPAYVEFSFI